MDADIRICAADDDRAGRVYQVLVRCGHEDWQQHCGPKVSFVDALEEAQKVQRRERGVRVDQDVYGEADFQRDASLYYRGDQVTPTSRPDGRTDMVGLAGKIRRARSLKGLKA